jgi:hypothetical protein
MGNYKGAKTQPEENEVKGKSKEQCLKEEVVKNVKKIKKMVENIIEFVNKVSSISTEPAEVNEKKVDCSRFRSKVICSLPYRYFPTYFSFCICNLLLTYCTLKGVPCSSLNHFFISFQHKNSPVSFIEVKVGVCKMAMITENEFL